MACLKIVQERIAKPTEARIGLGLFRRSEIFGLRFTPLLRTSASTSMPPAVLPERAFDGSWAPSDQPGSIILHNRE